ncbi:MAG: glycosyl hydrolase 108 family protein, partial [Desulfovibrionaceae bacterium]
MDSTFACAHKFTAQWEGGLSDHPADPGGITKYGVSLRWLRELAQEECRKLARSCDGSNAFDRKHAHSLAGIDFDNDGDIDADDIRACTKAQAAQLFKKHFWDATKCAKLPIPLAIVLYDGAVNMGA